jgi:predicted transposase
MKLTLQIQLTPDARQSRQMRETVERFNAAASWPAGKAFESSSANKAHLQQQHYKDLRGRFGLSAQVAVRCIAQFREAYERDKDKQPRFRQHASMPFDRRMMSFRGADRASLLTLGGRVVLPFR